MTRVRRTAPFVSGFLLALATPVVAQQPVFVVDALGGPGAHFSDLPPAIAAVPDGATLRVRPGTYSAFDLRKGLSIIGEDRDNVRIGTVGAAAPISIGPTSSTQTVLLRNLTLTPRWLPSGAVRVQSAAGAVAFDRVTFGMHFLPPFSVSGAEVDISTSRNVQLHHCDLLSNVHTALSVTDSALQLSHTAVRGISQRQCGVGADALHLVRSRCIAVASGIEGGDSSHATISLGAPCSPSGKGGTAATVDDGSTLIALGTAIRGGDGGSTTQFGSYYTVDHDGGDGLVVSSNSRAHVYGVAPTGGEPGGFSAGVGAPFSTAPGGTVQLDTAAVPTAGDVLGTQERGQVIHFSVDAAPGSIALLTIAERGGLVPLEPLLPGSLLFPTVLSVGPFPVQANGNATFGYTLPWFWPVGQPYSCQFLSAEPGTNRLWASNAVSLLVSR